MARYDLTVISFLAAFLVVVPFPWHWRAKNIATLTTMAWLFILNLFRAVNTIIWAGNVKVIAPAYCDIGTMLWTAAGWGLPASSVCITRHLAAVASPNFTPTGLNEKRHRFWFEMVMCVFMPFVFAGIHYIPQGHRFDIMEDLGCQPATYFTWAAIWLYYFPSLALSLIASIYAVLAIYWFMERRAQFRELLTASRSGLTTGRYLRLLSLGLAEIVLCFGYNIYILVDEFQLTGILPWISWENVHWHFGTPHQFPSVVMPPALKRSNMVMFTLLPVSAFAFFLFFAFGEEAVAEYKKNWVWVKIHIFRMDPSRMVGRYGNSTLPSFIGKSQATSGSVTDKYELSSQTAESTSAKWRRKSAHNIDGDDESVFAPYIDIEAPKAVVLSRSSSGVPPNSAVPPSRPPHLDVSANVGEIEISLSRRTSTNDADDSQLDSLELREVESEARRQATLSEPTSHSLSPGST